MENERHAIGDSSYTAQGKVCKYGTGQRARSGGYFLPLRGSTSKHALVRQARPPGAVV